VNAASFRCMLAWSLIGAPSMAEADVVLAGRLTASVSGDQLEGGAEAPAISPDGRYVVFASSSSNLGLPSNGSHNVYLYDLVSDVYYLAMSQIGVSGNSYAPSVAEGGTAVAFESDANNIVADGTSGLTDLFYGQAYDAGQGQVAFTTELVSKGLLGAIPNGASQNASISADGRWVAFLSYASNLVANDTNGAPDIFVGDANDGFATLQRVSVDGAGSQIDGYSGALSPNSISADGRYVAFSANTSIAIDGSNPNTLSDVFVRDRVAGTTSFVSKSTAGDPGGSSSDTPSMSPSGQFVVYRSFSTNLVSNPTGSRIYARDRVAGTTTNMPLPPNAASCEDPRVSDHGDIVAQCNLLSGPAQAFLYTAFDGSMYQISTSLTAGAGNGTSANASGISANGALVVFDSAASDLVTSDTNTTTDVFVVVPEADAAAGWLAAAAALAGIARRRGERLRT
jgi:Tol biopolymer transport system component